MVVARAMARAWAMGNELSLWQGLGVGLGLGLDIWLGLLLGMWLRLGMGVSITTAHSFIWVVQSNRASCASLFGTIWEFAIGEQLSYGH